MIICKSSTAIKCKSSSNITDCRGVHCSIIKGERKSTRHINLDSSEPVSNHRWRCSSNDDHHDFSPLYAGNSRNTQLVNQAIELQKTKNRSIDIDETIEIDERDEEEEIFNSIVMEKSRSLPSQSRLFISNHVLINKERLKNTILPLYRNNELDDIASEHARLMASQHRCHHSNVKTLVSNMSSSIPFRILGENVCSGQSLEDIHNRIITYPAYVADKNNILDRRYASFGTGVAFSSKGKMYVCQIFKG